MECDFFKILNVWQCVVPGTKSSEQEHLSCGEVGIVRCKSHRLMKIHATAAWSSGDELCQRIVIDQLLALLCVFCWSFSCVTGPQPATVVIDLHLLCDTPGAGGSITGSAVNSFGTKRKLVTSGSTCHTTIGNAACWSLEGRGLVS